MLEQLKQELEQYTKSQKAWQQRLAEAQRIVQLAEREIAVHEGNMQAIQRVIERMQENKT